jgi:hypothetical protein
MVDKKMIRISVAILTCDRLELTRKTVESFLKHNNRDNFDIFYGDDASTIPQIHKFMEKHSIPCLMKNKKRLGCSPSSAKLINLTTMISQLPYILYLQNDFESARPIPLNIIQQVFDKHRKVGWIRLYGLNKNDTIPGGNPTDPRHKFKGGVPGGPMVKWKKLEIDNEALEIGDAQWSYHPAIHRANVLNKITKGATRERDVGVAALKTGLLTARFTKNITNHIGIRKTTPGGKFGKPNRTYE